MAVYVDETTRLLVQNLTGREGSFHAAQPGVRHPGGRRGEPGQGAAATSRACRSSTPSPRQSPPPGRTRHGASSPAFAADSILEAAAHPGIELIVAITEGIPAHDEARVYNYLKQTSGTVFAHRSQLPRGHLPGQVQRRHHAARDHPSRQRRGGVAVRHPHLPGDPRVDPAGDRRSPPASASAATRCQAPPSSTCWSGLPGRPRDGGRRDDRGDRRERQEEAARFIRDHLTKPVVSYIAGVTAPAGKKMGHAGAIISGSSGTAQAKQAALREAGVTVVDDPTR